MLAVVRQNLLELALRATKRSHSVLRNKAKKVVFVEGENQSGKNCPPPNCSFRCNSLLSAKKKIVRRTIYGQSLVCIVILLEISNFEPCDSAPVEKNLA